MPKARTDVRWHASTPCCPAASARLRARNQDRSSVYPPDRGRLDQQLPHRHVRTGRVEPPAGCPIGTRQRSGASKGRNLPTWSGRRRWPVLSEMAVPVCAPSLAGLSTRALRSVSRRTWGPTPIRGEGCARPWPMSIPARDPRDPTGSQAGHLPAVPLPPDLRMNRPQLYHWTLNQDRRVRVVTRWAQPTDARTLQCCLRSSLKRPAAGRAAPVPGPSRWTARCRPRAHRRELILASVQSVAPRPSGPCDEYRWALVHPDIAVCVQYCGP